MRKIVSFLYSVRPSDGTSVCRLLNGASFSLSSGITFLHLSDTPSYTQFTKLTLTFKQLLNGSIIPS